MFHQRRPLRVIFLMLQRVWCSLLLVEAFFFSAAGQSHSVLLFLFSGGHLVTSSQLWILLRSFRGPDLADAKGVYCHSFVRKVHSHNYVPYPSKIRVLFLTVAGL